MTGPAAIAPRAGRFYGPETDHAIARYLGSGGLAELRQLHAASKSTPLGDLYWQALLILDSAARIADATTTSLRSRISAATRDYAAAEAELAAGASVEDLIGCYHDLPLLAARQADAMRNLNIAASAVAQMRKAARQLAP